MSRSDAAYEQLRTDLIAGRWLPGTTLSTYALSEELGMSRTPVIDALKRLEAEGLVEIVPQVGCLVVQRTSDEIVETLTIRGALEGLAAELAASRATSEELAELEETLRDCDAAGRRRDPEAYEECDRAFHEGIVRAGHHPQIDKVLSNLWLLDNQREAASRFLKSRMRQASREHRAIFNAIRDGNAADARRLLEAHVREPAVEFAEFVMSAAAESPAEQSA